MSHPGAVRTLLLGMRCGFTLPVAEALIAAPGVDVAGVIVPAAQCQLPTPHGLEATAPSPLDAMLRRHRIPMFETRSLRRHDLEPLLDGLDSGSLDAIVVACFPWRVPRWLRAFPRFGALNIHPSLLPALRGPEPEFWAIRLGLRETGVTVHLMDDDLDTGPILRQGPVPIPPDVTLPELETVLATIGGDLAREALRSLASGRATPRPQAGVPSYAPTPGAYDLAIPTNLPAGWAARFARAVAPVYAPLPVLVMATGQRLLVDEVVGVDERAAQAAPVEGVGGIVAVRFSPGVVRFSLARPDVGPPV